MNLRFCALFVSTLLSGCVLTDDTNLTGGDFLSAHGAQAGDTSSRSIPFGAKSVRSMALEGVPGANGTEPAVLGSLKGDSIRLVLAFNLGDASSKSDTGAHGYSSLRMRALSGISSISVHARYYLVVDSDNATDGFYGLFAGLEPSILAGQGFKAATLADDTTATIAFGKDSVGNLQLPSTISDTLKVRTATGAAKTWLIALIDTRKNGDFQVGFSSTEFKLATADTVSKLSLGSFAGKAAYRSIGLGSNADSKVFGYWAGGGRKLRMQFDRADVTTKTANAFSLPVNLDEGGFGHTAAILQARAGVSLSSVQATSTSTFSYGINSSVQMSDSSSGFPTITKDNPKAINLSQATLNSCRITSKPVVNARRVPGGFLAWIKLDGVTLTFPTRYSLAKSGSTSDTLSTFFVSDKDTVEVILYSLVRLSMFRDPAMPEQMTFSWKTLERAPVYDLQFKTLDSLRSSALLSKSGTFRGIQEVATPLTQLLNRWRTVEWEMVPNSYSNAVNATSTPSEAFVATPNSDKIFDSLRIVARPLIGRND